MLLPLAAHAAEEQVERQVEFNSAFLQGGPRVDISRFERGNAVLPGDYLVDLQINGQWTGRTTVRLVSRPGSDAAQPCIDRPIFDRIGIDLMKLSEQARAQLPDTSSNACVDVAGLIPEAAVKFDLSTLRLEISVPQASMTRLPRDFVDQQFWDEGVPTATMSYNLHAYRATAGGSTTTQGHVDLQSGANYSSWHLRHRSAVDVVSGGSPTYRSVATYLTHDIPAVRGNLVVGESFTDGAVFGSFAFRGVSLASSDQMLPDSRRDFAPVVRGVARTNARVVLAQNGVNLLETTVPPGPFEIDDLYATGYGGDLVVTVHEADGTVQNFIVPYSPMPQLMRPGVWRYTATAGTLQQIGPAGSQRFLEGTLQHGFNSLLTSYTGAIGAQHYNAWLLGVALNTPMGAFAADVSRSSAAFPNAPTSRGQAVRFSYSKVVRQTQTDISLSAYPHLSRGYLSLTEAASTRQLLLAGGVVADELPRTRRQWQVSINQNLPGRWGDLFLTASTRDLWNSDRSLTQLQGGYTSQLRFGRTRLSYGVSVSQQDDVVSGERDRRAQLNLSLPLGRSERAPTLSTSVAQQTRGGERSRGGQQVLVGSLGERHQFSYSLTGSQTDRDSTYTANGQYRGANASVSTSIGKGSGYSQQSVGASGGLVVHRGGVTLANQMTETFGIVEAAGAAGARVTNSVGTVVNRSGYAIIPFLLPYRMNSVSIDPEGTASADVEFQTTTVQVAPRLNSVVLIKFGTVEGRAILINARTAQGSEVPFGASVFDNQDNEVGLVGQDGRIYLRGIPEAGTLTVRWGDTSDEQCAFTYRLPARQEGAEAFVRLDAICRAEPDGQQG